MRRFELFNGLLQFVHGSLDTFRAFVFASGCVRRSFDRLPML
jgi:hypothetical protein